MRRFTLFALPYQGTYGEMLLGTEWSDLIGTQWDSNAWSYGNAQEYNKVCKSYGLRPVVSDYDSYRRWVDTSNIDNMGACAPDQ